MGKFIGSILSIAGIALGKIISGPLGAAFGLLFAAGVSLIFAPKAPKPQQAETTARSPSAPRIFGYGVRRVFGSYAFFGNSTSGASVDVIAYCDCQANSIEAVYLNDDVITISGGVVNSPDGEMYAGGTVQAGYNLGTTPNTAHSAVISAVPDAWTAAHRGDGLVSGYLIKNLVKDKKFLATYPQGDNVQMSLVIDMQPVFDFRNVAHDIGDSSTWEASANPVLHFLHYMIFERGYSYENAVLPKIDIWETAANICDEEISDEPRYQGCFLFSRTDKPHEIQASIIEAFDGWYSVDSLGQISVYAGAYYEPTVTIDASHVVEYSCQSFVEDENKYNEIIVKYFSSAHHYNEVEAQPWRDEDDIAARGVVNSTSISPQVPSYKQARRLAKALMARQNAANRGSVSTNYAGRIAEGQRFVNLELIEAGATIFSGPVEINKLTRNTETGGVSFEWTSVDANSWAWNPATEDGYGAPTGTFPTVDALIAPEITDASYSIALGSSIAELTVEGTGPDRSDLTWFLRWRYDGAAVWNEQRYDDIGAGATVTLVANLVPVDAPIEVQISYMVGGGTLSDWSNTLDVTADSAALAPAQPSEFAANDGAGSSLIEWRNPLSANFDHVDIYRNTTATFGTATMIASGYGALGQYMAYTDTVAAGTYYYWLVSISAASAESAPIGPDIAVVT